MCELWDGTIKDELAISIHETNVIKGTPKRKHNVETHTSTGGTSYDSPTK